MNLPKGILVHGIAGCWLDGTLPTHRSLFVVLDSLACTDGAISAAAQGWLVRALSLGDVARILEPMLLLLLQPKTQRTSIHCLKQENSAGEHTSQGSGGALCPQGAWAWERAGGRPDASCLWGQSRHLAPLSGLARFQWCEGTL